ncbi:MAG: oligosaccharide flippase family protein [Candidatus Lokiarchaeota archaeon]|nr:oligosaccharide flippase family protein [Candidatus Lokiarchaeota archaeon]
MNDVISFIRKYQFLGTNYFWKIIQKFSRVFIDFMILYISSFLLDPILFGAYQFLIILLGFFVILGEFGLSVSVSKYIAEFGIKDKEKIDSIIVSSIITYFIYCFIVFFIFIISNVFFLNINTNYLLYLILLLFLISGTNLFDGIFIGTKKFKISSLITLIPGIIVLPLSYILISTFSINGALLIHIFYYSLLIILMIKFSKIKNFHYDKRFINIILKYSLIIGFAGVGSFLYTYIDALILEQFGYTIEVGYYQIVFNIFNLIILPCSLFGQVISPYITQIGTKKEFNRIIVYLRKIWIIDIIGILIALGAFLVGPSFFRIFFPKYSNEILFSIWNIFLILIPFKIHNAVLIHGFIYPLGEGKTTMSLVLLGGVFNVILDYPFIILMGFIGVVYSTLIIHLIVVILTSIIFYIRIKRKFPK